MFGREGDVNACFVNNGAEITLFLLEEVSNKNSVQIQQTKNCNAGFRQI
jgi:hypothetical protein